MAAADTKSKTTHPWKWVAGGCAALLVIFVGLYIAGYFVAGNQVPAKSKVENVAIGGMSPDDAVAKLQAELGPRYDEPITVLGEDETSATITPSEAGMRPDFAAAVEDAGGGFSWNPINIIESLTGGRDVELPFEVDRDQLQAAVSELSPTFQREAVDGAVAYEGAKIERTDAVDALELDVEGTAAAVEAAYRAREPEANATLDSTAPAITNEMVDQEISRFAEPAISGPITITGGEAELVITPEQIAQSIRFGKDENGLTHSLDTKALLEATQESRDQLDLKEAKDATYKLENGEVVVVPAVNGLTMSDDTLIDAVNEVLTKTGQERTATVEVTEKKAEFTTEQAEAVKPNEVISEFSTQYPHAAYRNTNIGQAAANINGTVLMPGETFSFNDTVGERTAENGFTDGYIIDGGVLVRAAGGGVSQAATTAYNAGFFAGYEDVEHKPHSLYFSRYPAGREATVVWGAVDMKFKNTSKFPAVIKAWINESSPGNSGSVTVQIVSRPSWERVTATETQRSNYTTGQTREVSDPQCEPQAPIQGFTATYQRQFWQNGAVAKTEDFQWTYSPGDRIRCV